MIEEVFTKPGSIQRTLHSQESIAIGLSVIAAAKADREIPNQMFYVPNDELIRQLIIENNSEEEQEKLEQKKEIERIISEKENDIDKV